MSDSLDKILNLISENDIITHQIMQLINEGTNEYKKINQDCKNGLINEDKQMILKKEIHDATQKKIDELIKIIEVNKRLIEFLKLK